MVSTITRYNLDATTPTGILAINAAKVIMTFEADTADAKVQLFYNTGGFADNAYIDFSDGTILQSNNPSVFHQFLNNGLYDVTLIAENILTGCTDTMLKTDNIYCTGGPSVSIIEVSKPLVTE